MSVFEYLVALVSVVVGLAIARTLGALLQLVHHRDSVQVDWIPLTWTATLLLWTVFFWWFTFGMADAASTWRMRNLLFVLGYAGSIYLALGMLFPSDIGPGFDLGKHFSTNHRWFFGTLALLAAFDVSDTVYKIVNFLAVPGTFYYMLLGSLVLGSAVGWWVRHRRYHAFFAVTFFVMVVIQVVFNTRVVGDMGVGS